MCLKNLFCGLDCTWILFIIIILLLIDRVLPDLHRRIFGIGFQTVDR